MPFSVFHLLLSTVFHLLLVVGILGRFRAIPANIYACHCPSSIPREIARLKLEVKKKNPIHAIKNFPSVLKDLRM